MTATKTKVKATAVKTKSSVVVVTTIADMVRRFLELKSTTFVQLWQTTPNISRMRKTGNRFYGKVEKVNCLNAVTNYNYEAMVNRARSKEAMANLRQAMENAGIPTDKIDNFLKGAKSDVTDNAETFKSAGLSWGEYVGDSKCIITFTPDENGKSPFAGIEGFYIQLAIIHYAEPVYKWIETGAELTADEVAELKTFITPKKAEGERQGLSKPYVIRAPRFETIDAVSFQGANYQLRK